MDIFFICLGMLSASLIAWQDLKEREIHLAFLLLFGISGVCYFFYLDGTHAFSALVPSFAGISILLLLLVFLVKKLSGRPVMDEQLGWGDVLMIYALAAWWDPFAFLIFYTLSTCLLACFFLLAQYSGKLAKDFPIPLAGAWALAFLFFFPLYHLFPLSIVLP